MFDHRPTSAHGVHRPRSIEASRPPPPSSHLYYYSGVVVVEVSRGELGLRWTTGLLLRLFIPHHPILSHMVRIIPHHPILSHMVRIIPHHPILSGPAAPHPYSTSCHPSPSRSQPRCGVVRSVPTKPRLFRPFSSHTILSTSSTPSHPTPPQPHPYPPLLTAPHHRPFAGAPDCYVIAM